MKKVILPLLVFTMSLTLLSAQHNAHARSTIAILNIDISGNLKLSPEQAGNLIRMELEKLDSFEVLDRYETAQKISHDSIDNKNCFSKSCLIELGKKLNADYMISGTIESLGSSIFITLRLVSVVEGKIIKTSLQEYIALDNELTTMLKVSFNQMFNLPTEEILLSKLTVKYDYENQLNNPNKTRINLGGPRFGVVGIYGKDGKILKKKYDEGGFQTTPYMTQWGYQLELQYLNEKRIQVLLEFIGILTGLENKLLMPSLAVLNGFRDSKKGWEFAFGFSFGVIKEAEFVDYQGKQWLYQDLKINEAEKKTLTTYKQLDSRGQEALTTSFVVAFGKTFKSGRVNLPVNLFFAGNTDNIRIGLMVGWNAKNK